jgi:hypothetical protein
VEGDQERVLERHALWRSGRDGRRRDGERPTRRRSAQAGEDRSRDGDAEALVEHASRADQAQEPLAEAGQHEAPDDLADGAVGSRDSQRRPR